MLRLTLAGAHTLLTSTLCARCPQGPAGCCASPPAVAFTDIGRIVRLGGRDFLLGELAAGRLRPIPRGLAILRAPPSGGLPARCVYHGPEGCSIPPERRSATCNYYICDDAFAFGGEGEGEREVEGEGGKGVALMKERRVHDALTALYGQWDSAIGDRVRSRYPGGPPWDADFFDWLGAEFERVTAGQAPR